MAEYIRSAALFKNQPCYYIQRWQFREQTASVRTNRYSDNPIMASQDYHPLHLDAILLTRYQSQARVLTAPILFCKVHNAKSTQPLKLGSDEILHVSSDL